MSDEPEACIVCGNLVGAMVFFEGLQGALCIDPHPCIQRAKAIAHYQLIQPTADTKDPS